MKQPVNFRLSQHALLVLNMLEKKLHVSRTAVIEESLQFYAERKFKSQLVIMRFVGTLSDEASSNILKIIKKGRRNKNIKINL